MQFPQLWFQELNLFDFLSLCPLCFSSPFFPPPLVLLLCHILIQVLHDLLQQRVQAHVHLRLLQQLDEVDVVGDDLTQVGHLLKQLGKQL